MIYQSLEWRTLQRNILDTIKIKVNQRTSQGLPKPKLCVILVGNNSASLTYIRGKEKACWEVGINFELKQFAPTISEEALISAIHDINVDPTVHGCIIQLPLPTHIRTDLIIDQIDPRKDVDGFTRENIGNLYLGRPALESCTPAGIMRLLAYYDISLTGKEVVVIGRSTIVGRPLALMLTHAGATVTLAHSHTKDLKTHTQRADIVIIAIGKSGYLTADMVRTGAVVIDVGINRGDDNKLTGDSDYAEIIKKAHCSPVPGWVGPMTIALLLENTLRASEINL